MDDLTIRLAQPSMQDAARLHILEAETMGDSGLTVAEMCRVLHRPEHYTYIVECSGTWVGFCSTFETSSPAGKRLEIDMLGVKKSYRRQGAATLLVSHAVSRAVERGVTNFRGIVAEDNVESRRVFAKAGFEQSRRPSHLLIYDIRGTAPQSYLPAGWRVMTLSKPMHKVWPQHVGPYVNLVDHDVLGGLDSHGAPAFAAAMLPVQTLAYSGAWIESLWARDEQARGVAARAVVEYGKALDVQEVGCLLPAPTKRELRRYAKEGFLDEGRYLVMTRQHDT